MIRSEQRIHDEMENPRGFVFTDLLQPLPDEFAEIADFQPLFDTVLAKVKERPLTFDEAGRQGFDELRRNRRLEFELLSWNSEGSHGRDVDDQTPMVGTGRGLASPAPTVIFNRTSKPSSIPSAQKAPVAPRNSSMLETHRRATGTPQIADQSYPGKCLIGGMNNDQKLNFIF